MPAPLTPYETGWPDDLLVWVLVPAIEKEDPNLQYYYDFTQSLEEYSRVFAELNLPWKWQPVNLNNYREVLGSILDDCTGTTPLILNLCDGDEVNGAPGVSVLHCLQEQGFRYTGADEHYYKVTTSKIPMKRLFDAAGVPTPPWEDLGMSGRVNGVLTRIEGPLLVKPAVSAGSMGIGIRSVVHNKKDLLEQVRLLRESYRGWQVNSGGVIAEKFILGQEYTSLIVGPSGDPGACKVYMPVERVFHPALPETEKFLSFDRLWETYEEESPIGDYEDFYTYELPDKDLIDAIKSISLDAYKAVGGKGYGRIDLRRDRVSGQIYVLEVNAQCGLSADENYTSIGAILRLSGVTYSELIRDILLDGLIRERVPAPAREAGAPKAVS